MAEDEEGFKAIVMSAQVQLTAWSAEFDLPVFIRDEAWVVVERLAQRLRAVDMVMPYPTAWLWNW